MNKKISTPVAIVIILACAVLVAGLAFRQYFGLSEREEAIIEEKQPEDMILKKEISKLLNPETTRL